MENELREKLAELCHSQWSGWMVYLFNKSIHNDDKSVTIPAELVERWARQMNTPYGLLSQSEQDSDRNEADKFIELINGK